MWCVSLLIGNKLRAVIRQNLVRDTVPRKPGLEDQDRCFSRRVRDESPAGDEPGGIVKEGDQPLCPTVDGYLFPIALPETHGMGPLEADPFRSCRCSFLRRNESPFPQNPINHRMRDHTTGLGGDTPGEDARAELVDPTIDQDQEHCVPWRRPRSPPGTLQDRRRTMNASITKYLIHPFPADAISCGKGRDSLATMIRRDDGRGIISRQPLHIPGRVGCQVTRRLYSFPFRATAGADPVLGA